MVPKFVSGSLGNLGGGMTAAVISQGLHTSCCQGWKGVFSTYQSQHQTPTGYGEPADASKGSPSCNMLFKSYHYPLPVFTIAKQKLVISTFSKHSMAGRALVGRMQPICLGIDWPRIILKNKNIS